MSHIELQIYHDCQKPSMVVDEDRVNYRVGVWPFRATETRTIQTYEPGTARWVCDTCDSQWTWHGSKHFNGYWRADVRTSNWVFREEIPVGYLTTP